MMSKVDTDGNGEIDFDEVRSFFVKSASLSSSCGELLLALAVAHLHQFCKMMGQPMESFSHEEEMLEAFRVFDTDNDGFISKVPVLLNPFSSAPIRCLRNLPPNTRQFIIAIIICSHMSGGAPPGDDAARRLDDRAGH